MLNQLKYQKVEAEIRKLTYDLPVGAKLPGERDLAITHNCNFLTVRKALKRLVKDGTIIRQIGSGTYVSRRQKRNGADASSGDSRIGVLVYQESNAYAFRLLQSIAHAGIDLKMDIRSIWIRDFGADALHQIDMLKRARCAAATLPWFPHEKIDEVRRFVKKCPLPVSLPMVISGLEKYCFEREDVFGASSTTETVAESCRYLKALGHQRIAFIGPDSTTDMILQKKISGYIHYASRENLPSLCGLVGADPQAMDRLAERWKSHRENLAIVTYDDEHALRFMIAMHKIGLRVPEDYCIIGYNNTVGSETCDSPLSSIQQNFDYIGQTLLKSAYALANGQICQSSEVPTLKMLIRESCGGRDKVTEAFRSQFGHIDLLVDGQKVPQ